jgi:hypothetical protein
MPEQQQLLYIWGWVQDSRQRVAVSGLGKTKRKRPDTAETAAVVRQVVGPGKKLLATGMALTLLYAPHTPAIQIAPNWKHLSPLRVSTVLETLQQRVLCLAVSPTYNHLILVTEEGNARYTCTEGKLAPVELPGPVRTVSCGNVAAVALLCDGSVYAVQFQWTDQHTCTAVPQAVQLTEESTVTAIAAGHTHFAAVLASGQVFTWGRCQYGALGVNVGMMDTVPSAAAPVEVLALQGLYVTQVSCGLNFTVVATKHGAVYSFGTNAFGQLGHARDELVDLVDLPYAEMGTSISALSCGASHTLCVTSDHRVYGWGSDIQGQISGCKHHSHCVHVNNNEKIATGQEPNICKPKRIQDLTASTVACGRWHSAALLC